MEILPSMVKELREKTGAGVMECKKALIETDGNLEAAITYLRERGRLTATRRAGRVTSEGLVGSYVHTGGKVGVLVEVNCETDFVARTEEFQTLVKDIAMHIAALQPQYVRREDVSQEVVEKEKAIYRTQALESGKPEKVVDKIVAGRIERFFSEVCLLEQPFVKDLDITVQRLLTDMIARLGENITIRRFARFKIGEGMVHSS